ncbi:hypothetical protein KCU67_g10974, partial [Aureobasidium melanogenum]
QVAQKKGVAGSDASAQASKSSGVDMGVSARTAQDEETQIKERAKRAERREPAKAVSAAPPAKKELRRKRPSSASSEHGSGSSQALEGCKKMLNRQTVLAKGKSMKNLDTTQTEKTSTRSRKRMKEHILDPDHEEEGSKSAVHKELQELLDVIEESESENEDNVALEPARPKVVGRFVTLKLSWSGGGQSSFQASKVSSTTKTFLCDDDFAKFLEDVLLSQNTR